MTLVNSIPIYLFTERNKGDQWSESDSMSTVSSNKISTDWLIEMRQNLVCRKNKPSTRQNYHGIWNAFNKFLLKLDWIPDTWEEKTSIYCTYLVEVKGVQSSTLKSYLSAIKTTLKADGYKWNEDLIWFHALTKACQLQNDHVTNRFPIKQKFLECILFEVWRYFTQKGSVVDLYNRTMYTSAFANAYYGMLRIGEITESEHVLKAVDVHTAKKNGSTKLKLILRSSKTHTKGMRPQEIEIKQNPTSCFCPVKETLNYISIRPGYRSENDQFYIYSDGSPLTSDDFRDLLKSTISTLELNPKNYDTHSFRIGRATDLFKQGRTSGKNQKHRQVALKRCL